MSNLCQFCQNGRKWIILHLDNVLNSESNLFFWTNFGLILNHWFNGTTSSDFPCGNMRSFHRKICEWCIFGRGKLMPEESTQLARFYLLPSLVTTNFKDSTGQTSFSEICHFKFRKLLIIALETGILSLMAVLHSQFGLDQIKKLLIFTPFFNSLV